MNNKKEIDRLDFTCIKTACNNYTACNSARIPDSQKQFIPAIQAIIMQTSGLLNNDTKIILECYSYRDFTTELNNAE